MPQYLIKSDDYKAFIQDIKQRVQSAQIKAAVSVNQELLRLYWDLAERIVAKQRESAWGEGFLTQMSRDLQAEFPGMKGFSKRNLELMRQWYQFWSPEPTIAQQLVAQIPWGHNLVIISKIKNAEEALFYIQGECRGGDSCADVLSQHLHVATNSGWFTWRTGGPAAFNFSSRLSGPLHLPTIPIK